MKIKLTSELLFEIINNTSNPEVAIKLIDGNYKAPKLAKTATIGKEQEVAKLVSFDKWSNKVTYKLPNDSIDTMDRKEWMRCAEGIEDVSVVMPKDIKLMEAMAESQMVQE
jgi:hypothetical protein